MGASESKLVFKQGIFRLSEEKEIPADDPYWTRVNNPYPDLPRSKPEIADNQGVVLGAPRIYGGCLQPIYPSGHTANPRQCIRKLRNIITIHNFSFNGPKKPSFLPRPGSRPRPRCAELHSYSHSPPPIRVRSRASRRLGGEVLLDSSKEKDQGGSVGCRCSFR